MIIPADEALKKLSEGNKKYIEAGGNTGDVSSAARFDTAKNGQSPYAVIIACSDSRVIPETIFSAGIGDLFVIRVAGNVIDKHQLGSVEYALSHLGTKLVVVLGHTGCGAVSAALHHDPDGHIRFITDEIKRAIGDETDPTAAARLNALHSMRMIERNIDIKRLEKSEGVKIAAAMYDIESGEVTII